MYPLVCRWCSRRLPLLCSRARLRPPWWFSPVRILLRIATILISRGIITVHRSLRVRLPMHTRPRLIAILHPGAADSAMWKFGQHTRITLHVKGIVA